MKDSESRERIAKLEAENKELERRITNLENLVDSYTMKDSLRRVSEIAKVLGFTFNGDGVFDSTIKDPASSVLGKLQIQISALIASLNLEETYQDGKLIFKEARGRR